MMVIREARAVDAPAIGRVHVEAWRSTYAGLLPDHVLVRMSQRSHINQWARMLARGRSDETVLVAQLSGIGVVGFGSCGPNREKRLPHSGEVYTLYVLPEHQERGIGRQLLRGLFDALVAGHRTSAAVWVLADNPARFFYECMGGRRVAERDEEAWNTVLREAAYGWPDLTRVRAQSPARRAR
jgi:L-amino acid N-acyltransferase YncA